MHLIRNDVAGLANQVITEFCQLYKMPSSELYNVEDNLEKFSGQSLSDYSHTLDYGAAGWIAAQSQTFIFDVDQVQAFIRSIDRQLPPGDYPAPFEYMCIQFSRGIDEKLFTTGLRSSGSVEQSDEILGLFIAAPDGSDAEYRFLNVIAWYKSTSINRIQMNVAGDGTIEYRPLDDTIEAIADELYRDKQRLANLAMLCLAYIDTPGMEIERVYTPDAVNRKRESKGKRRLEDYYVCRWNRDRVRYTAGQPGESERTVSFRFDVTGHFRRLADGRVIWIRPHQRGLEHERYVPKVYRVE